MEPIDLSAILPHLRRTPAFERVRALSAGRILTLGVGDAAKPAALAAIAGQREGPVVVITTRADRAEALAEELSVWLGADAEVLLYPERDALPYERLAAAPDIVRDRLRAAAALSTGERCIIVASALAIAQRTLAPGAAVGSIRRLSKGDRLEMDAFLGELAALGYSIEPVVAEAGQASRRGGIIDVFPPGAELPVRIELLGREIDSLRAFDPSTQRSVGPVEMIEIGPARELVSPDLSGLRNLDFGRCTVAARERFEEELTNLEAGVVFEGRDFYVPLLAQATLLDHLPEDSLLVLDERADIAAVLDEALEEAETARGELEERGEVPRGLPSALERWHALEKQLAGRSSVLTLSRWATDEAASENAADVVRLAFAGQRAYGGQLRKLVLQSIEETRAGHHLIVVSQQAQRLAELFAEEDTPVSVSARAGEALPRLTLLQGSLAEGWRFSENGLELGIVTDTEVFGFAKQRRATPRRTVNREAFLAELTPGAYVVHIDHGIARFSGVVRMSVDGHEREYLELQYAEKDKLFVPTDQLDRVSRYIGPSDRQPHLTRLASGEWQRAKARVRKAVQALARDLLALYAAREVLRGHSYSADSPWQMELEASFPYVETPDQIAAIAAVKQDMEAARPMDRLVCGDVGYGKTEVAVRAAFKTVMEGRQVGVLVPTTVLAQQHFQTFRERLAAFPVRVEMLSRFRSEAEQRQVTEELAAGTIDIVIGTHRLLQKDVSFKDLGLVVIDEEQRFGVAHKEHLKKMRREVDVLTLSATPIPRTLYMALGALRDMSTMETPPEERLPIKTYVSEFDERLVRETVVREIERGGQVYFVHNRVHNIDMIAGKLQETVPEARISVGHGQMDEHDLEQVMREFVGGETDVLVCTTIIESGLDIPNVNTIIINQADKLGLGQLYQLRGRVGRGAHRAYAYLFYDRQARLTETARQRLQTIFEATELGAGFQIALRDLEIRGAGNLLGAEQSGFMAAVGFDLYVKLLSGAVEQMRAVMRGEPPQPEADGTPLTIDLPLSAHLPPAYVSDLNVRLALYQRLSAAGEPKEVAAIGQEMVDRFGEPPAAARNLLYVISLRSLATEIQAQSITTEDGVAVVRMKEGEPLAREALESVVAKGVQVGRNSLRVELDGSWRERLRRTLEQVASVRGAGGQ
ncbi:MAG: transcription-repair coupling factor [Chloroflexi bacterium]|nr:MAG: transcription-repair coupling factor [Chloroflexota bacterium]